MVKCEFSCEVLPSCCATPLALFGEFFYQLFLVQNHISMVSYGPGKDQKPEDALSASTGSSKWWCIFPASIGTQVSLHCPCLGQVTKFTFLASKPQVVCCVCLGSHRLQSSIQPCTALAFCLQGPHPPWLFPLPDTGAVMQVVP